MFLKRRKLKKLLVDEKNLMDNLKEMQTHFVRRSTRFSKQKQNIDHDAISLKLIMKILFLFIIL